ncbi:MAG: Hsp20/alpha crystallin family protein [Planctomycetaceae bacterium]|nr:Hsp20/alpha crystallin family protein [Planctomycetales bacterium]MCB9925095.1 Hsp20/alpha crystallin family protein [Planctomycetaceae bacterium]
MLRSLVPRRERSLRPTGDRFTGMFGQLEQEMRDLMENFWGDGGQLATTNFVPSVDVVENEKEFEVTVDLPGLKPEEVKVEFQDGALWITGERKEEKEEKEKTYHRIERSYGEFRRVLPLGSMVKEGEIEAKFTNGVLKVSVPKSEEVRTKRIEVKS